MPGAVKQAEYFSALTAENFSGLMGRYPPLPEHLAVAVSGGPDSMALAHLLHQWCQAQGRQLTALIVDHALRANSATEAASTLTTLKAAGITAHILKWGHGPIEARIHATAREARYSLIFKACREMGISTLFTAHHADDQAETVLMRLAKGSGVDGLAGMAAISMRDGMTLLRPLLSIRKEQLVATCKTANINFATDPSNESEKYARGRLRKILPLLAEEGLTVERLIDLSERAADAKHALDHARDIFLKQHTKLIDGAAITMERGAFHGLPKAVAQRCLGAALSALHPSPHPVEQKSFDLIFQALSVDEEFAPRTIQGCALSASEKTISLFRELSHIPQTTPIEAGTTVLWDNRYAISLATGLEEDWIIRPLGNPPHDVLDSLSPGLRKDFPQGRIRATLPSLWKKGILKHVPQCKIKEMPVKFDVLVEWPPVQIISQTIGWIPPTDPLKRPCS